MLLLLVFHSNPAYSAVATAPAMGFLGSMQAVVMVSAVAGVHDAVDVLTASGLLIVSCGPCY
jgi:hypothetical protein